MSLTINTNVNAIQIHSSMLGTNRALSNSMQHLSTGLRINSAKDDASGFSIANHFAAQTSSMKVAYQNASEAQSMLQVADGGYSQINNILGRMKDLATQAASGQSSQVTLNSEFQSLSAEISRIASSTNYNGTQVINGAASAGVTFQIGATNSTDNQVAICFSASDATSLGVGSGVAGVGTMDIGSVSNAQQAMTQLDTALASINAMMSSVGTYQNRLQFTMDNLTTTIQNYQASQSAIQDVDMAAAMTDFTKQQILSQTQVAMMSQANQAPQQILKLIGA